MFSHQFCVVGLIFTSNHHSIEWTSGSGTSSFQSGPLCRTRSQRWSRVRSGTGSQIFELIIIRQRTNECSVFATHEGPSIPDVRAWKNPCQCCRKHSEMSQTTNGRTPYNGGTPTHVWTRELVVCVDDNGVALVHRESRTREGAIWRNSTRIL